MGQATARAELSCRAGISVPKSSLIIANLTNLPGSVA